MAPVLPGITGSLVQCGTVQPQLETTLCTTIGFLLILVNLNLQLTLLSLSSRSPKSWTFSSNLTTSSSGLVSLFCAASGIAVSARIQAATIDTMLKAFIVKIISRQIYYYLAIFLKNAFLCNSKETIKLRLWLTKLQKIALLAELASTNAL